MPLNRNRPRIFPGWWVVVSCTLVLLYTAGVTHFAFTAILEPLASEFGWSYAQISLAASLRGLETGLLSPLMGLLVDRWGPRKLVWSGSFVTGLGMVLLSRINSLTAFYGAFFLIAVGSGATGHAVMAPAVANWFRRRVATALGIMASGAALGGLLVPAVTVLIDIFDWRTAMLVLGLGIWVICFPLSLLVRDRPERYGLRPDGDTADTVAVSETDVRTKSGGANNNSAREIIKQRAFWHITLALMCISLVSGAVLTHVMPYLSSVGVSRSTGSLVAMGLPLMSILGRFTFGPVADRFDKKRVTILGFLLTSAGLLFFAYVSSSKMWLLAPFLFLYSVGWGSTVTLRPALLRHYFGEEKFGTIHGVALGIMHSGGMIGAPLAGWVFDEWRSYRGIWFILAALIAAAILFLVTIPRRLKAPAKPEM